MAVFSDYSTPQLLNLEGLVEHSHKQNYQQHCQMLLNFTKCLIQSITEAMIRLEGSLVKDLLLWMESQVIACNQGDVPDYNTLESCILLLIQVPNKKQFRNF